MTDVCRFCLSKHDVNHHIFNEQNDDLFVKIETFLPIKIMKADKLPKKICNECSSKIDSFHKYCKKVLKAEKLLLELNPHTRTTSKETNLTSKSKHHFERKRHTYLERYKIKEIISDSDTEQLIKLEPLENSCDNLKNIENFDIEYTPANSAKKSVIQKHERKKSTENRPDEEYKEFNETQILDLNDVNIEVGELKFKISDSVDVKKENEDNAEDDFKDDYDVQYSSEDDLTLNNIIKIPIKEEKELVVKKRKYTKRKRDGDEESGETRKRRGRPKGSLNKRAISNAPKRGTKLSNMLKTEVLVARSKAVIDDEDVKFEEDKDCEDVPVPVLKLWKCLTCFVMLETRTDLLRHYKDHVENPSKVRLPNEIKSEELMEDVKDELEDSKSDDLSNPECQKFIRVKSPEFGESPAYQCLKCCKMFVNKRSVIRHLICHDDSRPFPCNICGRTYKRAYEIVLHGRVHNGVKTLFCKYDQCSYSTVYRGALMSHHKRHEPSFKYICDICNKGFDVLTWFTEHKNIHTGAKPFTCDLCGKSFIYSRYLSSHRKSVHPETAERKLLHRCTECPQEFQERKQLRTHAAKVHGAMGGCRVLCDICGKELSSKEHLKFHRRIHTGEKPHVCRSCGKGFVKKCNLTLHERVHSGEKPHVCLHCGKAFSQRSTLVIHERYHSGARPYQCKVCNKGFVAKGLLSMHQKTCI